MAFWDKFKSKKENEVIKSGGSHARKLVSREKTAEDTEKVVKSKSVKKTQEGRASIEKRDVDPLVARVIVSPLVSEKSAVLAHGSQYTFQVQKDASKTQVKNAIKMMYGVEPLRVNMQNYRGDNVRFGRTQGKRKSWKKAIVIMPKGKHLDVFEGV